MLQKIWKLFSMLTGHHGNWLVWPKPQFNKKIPRVFGFYQFCLKFWIFSETLVVELTIFFYLQKENPQWNVYVKLDWKMVLGESITSTIWVLCRVQYWLAIWGDWKNIPKWAVIFSNMEPSKTPNYDLLQLPCTWKSKCDHPGTFYICLE